MSRIFTILNRAQWLLIISVLLYTIVRCTSMNYRVISYETKTIGVKYGFAERRGMFGKWEEIAYGADSSEEAMEWIKMQPRF